MQPLDRLGTYSNTAVLDALRGRLGTRTIAFRYDRLGATNKFIEPIDYVLAGSVANNALADVKRTAKFTILDRTGINYLSDRIRPWMRLAMPDGGWVEWPLGVFILATPSRARSVDGVISREVEAYDQLLALKQETMADRYSIAAGTLYTAAIDTIATGYAKAITPSAATLLAALEWEPGTSRLSILNDLLAAINYESATFDEVGTLICRPYQSPAARSAEFDYSSGELALISGEVGQSLDLFNVPNRWVAVKSEADQPVLRSVYTNTSPTSPTSTVARGRTITDFRTENDAPDQATLDALVARRAFEASQVFEIVEFSTPLMPIHSNADVLNVTMPSLAIAAKYSEQSWEMPLTVGGRMAHKVRRVVTV